MTAWKEFDARKEAEKRAALRAGKAAFDHKAKSDESGEPFDPMDPSEDTEEIALVRGAAEAAAAEFVVSLLHRPGSHDSGGGTSGGVRGGARQGKRGYIEAVATSRALRGVHFRRLGVLHIAALFHSRGVMEASADLLRAFDKEGKYKTVAQRCVPYHPPLLLAADGPSSMHLLKARAPINHLFNPD